MGWCKNKCNSLDMTLCWLFFFFQINCCIWCGIFTCFTHSFKMSSAHRLHICELPLKKNWRYADKNLWGKKTCHFSLLVLNSVVYLHNKFMAVRIDFFGGWENKVNSFCNITTVACSGILMWPFVLYLIGFCQNCPLEWDELLGTERFYRENPSDCSQTHASFPGQIFSI